MKKYVTLYDASVLFPIWFLLLMPDSWLFLAATQFIMASFVLIGGLKYMGYDNVSAVWKKSILWNSLYGFIGYLIACGLYLPTQFFSEGSWLDLNLALPVAANPFTSPVAVLYMVVAIALAGLFSYFMNKKLSFRRTDLTKDQIRKISLYLSLFTAPYITLLPSEFFYRGTL